MSGGHFDYQQSHLMYIADEIEQLIDTNELNGYNYTPETIKEFKTAVELLRKAYIYAQRIDWLVSGDDGEETFHKRLKAELNNV